MDHEQTTKLLTEYRAEVHALRTVLQRMEKTKKQTAALIECRIVEPYTGTPAAGKLPRLTVPDRTGLLWPWLGWCFVSPVRPFYWCLVFAK